MALSVKLIIITSSLCFSVFGTWVGKSRATQQCAEIAIFWPADLWHLRRVSVFRHSGSELPQPTIGVFPRVAPDPDRDATNDINIRPADNLHRGR
jgi:hypothetical protein